MELLQMKYFLAVAREESISRAADFLYITQPSLTRQIQSMEKEVGQQLFVRGGKKMRLTEAGLLLKKRAEEILALYEKTESELIHPQQSVSGNVYLGGGESHAMQLLLDIANEMRTQYPNIKLHTAEIFPMYASGSTRGSSTLGLSSNLPISQSTKASAFLRWSDGDC